MDCEPVDGADPYARISAVVDFFQFAYVNKPGWRTVVDMFTPTEVVDSVRENLDAAEGEARSYPMFRRAIRESADPLFETYVAGVMGAV